MNDDSKYFAMLNYQILTELVIYEKKNVKFKKSKKINKRVL